LPGHEDLVHQRDRGGVRRRRCRRGPARAGAVLRRPDRGQVPAGRRRLRRRLPAQGPAGPAGTRRGAGGGPRAAVPGRGRRDQQPVPGAPGGAGPAGVRRGAGRATDLRARRGFQTALRRRPGLAGAGGGGRAGAGGVPGDRLRPEGQRQRPQAVPHAGVRALRTRGGARRGPAAPPHRLAGVPRRRPGVVLRPGGAARHRGRPEHARPGPLAGRRLALPGARTPPARRGHRRGRGGGGVSTQFPLVSVVIPNYNYAATLGPCIRAVQAQTYPNLEIVVADDCSTDNSVEIARSLGARVVRTPGNSGQAVARNLGAAKARGEILFFVDSDLVLAPDAVANAVELLQADPRTGAVCGLNDPDPLIRDGRLKEYRALQYHYWSLTPDGIVPVLFSAMFAVRADVFAELGPFDPRLRWSEEFEYGHRISRRYHIRLSERVRGRHDPDATLGGLLRKLFHRGRVRVPLYAQTRRFARGFETGPRALGSVAALLG